MCKACFFLCVCVCLCVHRPLIKATDPPPKNEEMEVCHKISAGLWVLKGNLRTLTWVMTSLKVPNNFRTIWTTVTLEHRKAVFKSIWYTQDISGNLYKTRWAVAISEERDWGSEMRRRFLFFHWISLYTVCDFKKFLPRVTFFLIKQRVEKKSFKLRTSHNPLWPFLRHGEGADHPWRKGQLPSWRSRTHVGCGKANRHSRGRGWCDSFSWVFNTGH